MSVLEQLTGSAAPSGPPAARQMSPLPPRPRAAPDSEALSGPPTAQQPSPLPPRHRPPTNNGRHATLSTARPHSPSPCMLQATVMDTESTIIDATNAPLPSDSDSDMEAGEPWRTQSKKRPRRGTPVFSQENDTATPKVGRIPPIIVTGVTKWTPLFSSLRGAGADFNAKFVGQALHLHATNVESFRLIQRNLADRAVDFHTFSLKEEQELKTVLRGLPSFTSPEEIKEALEDAGFTPTHVTALERRDDDAHHATNSFYIKFRKSGSWAQIWEQRELLGIRVTFSLFTPKNSIPQCYRCQQFGHGSGSCHRPTRCVRCGGPHAKSLCLLPAGDPPKCANCSGPHPASWRGCKAHKDAQRAQTRREPARGQPGNRQQSPRRQRPVPAPRRPTQPPPPSQAHDPDQADDAQPLSQPAQTAPASYAQVAQRRRRNRPNRKLENRPSNAAPSAPATTDAAATRDGPTNQARRGPASAPPRPSPRQRPSTQANPRVPGPSATPATTPAPTPADTTDSTSSPHPANPTNLPDSVSGVTLFRWMMTALPLILQGGLSPEDLLKALMASMSELLSYG